MSLKPSDRWTISLCCHHHAEQHRIGERAFETRYALDLVALAETFARCSPHTARLAYDGPRPLGDAPIAAQTALMRAPRSPRPLPAPAERFHDLEVYSELLVLARHLAAQSARCWTLGASRAFLAAAATARLVTSALYKANLAEGEDASEGA